MQQLQRAGDARMRGEELQRRVHAEIQDLAGRQPAQAHLQGLGVESQAAAVLAGLDHVGQEVHLHPHGALPLASRASAGAGVEGKPRRRETAHARLHGVGEQLADVVPDAHVGGRTGTRGLADRGLVDLQHALDALQPQQGLAAHGRPLAGQQRARAGEQHPARQTGLARARHPGEHRQAPAREAHVHVAQIVQACAAHFERGGARAGGRTRHQRVTQGLAQVAGGEGVGVAHQLLQIAHGHHGSPQAPGAGADVQDGVGAPDGVLVVLHHHQGAAPRAQLVQRIQQAKVVPRVQADGRLVEHVGHAAQIAAQLRSQPDALRLAAGQGGSRAVQRQVAQPDALQEMQAGNNFRHEVAAQCLFAQLQAQVPEPLQRLVHGQRGQILDRALAPAHGQRHGVQARAGALGAGGRIVHVAPAALLPAVFGLEAGELGPGAETGGTPAGGGVVGELARIQLGKTASTGGAGAQGAEAPQFQRRVGADHVARGHGLAQALQGPDHLHHALAQLHGLVHQLAQRIGMLGLQFDLAQGQRDVVLAEAVRTRPGLGGQEGPVHPEVAVPAPGRPLGQLRVHALALHHQRRHDAHRMAAQFAHQLGADGLLGLRGDRHLAIGAVLGAQLGVQQAQEGVHLGERAHGALASATAGALRDRHGGRNAEDGVHVRARRRLHELARIGVDGFQVAPLALAEQHVEGQRALA